MPYVHQDNHFIAFVIPDNADIHVDAALEKVRGALDAFGPQRRMGRIFSQKFQLVFKLLLLLGGQTLEMLLSGGYVFYGGLFGGLLAAVSYCRRYRISLRAAADFYAPALPLFHVFGRIGCFLAGCCWGIEAPWGVVYTHSLAAPNGVTLFPVQLTEAVCNLAICMVLLLRERRLSGRQPTGGALLLHAALYACVRFLLEFWRGDAVRGHFLFFSTSQWISVLILFAIGIYFWNIVRSRQL